MAKDRKKFPLSTSELERDEDELLTREKKVIPRNVIDAVRDFFKKFGVEIKVDTHEGTERIYIKLEDKTSIYLMSGSTAGQINFQYQVAVPAFDFDIEKVLKSLKHIVKKIGKVGKLGYLDLKRYTLVEDSHYELDDCKTEMIFMAKDVDLTNEKLVLQELKELMKVLGFKKNKSKKLKDR